MADNTGYLTGAEAMWAGIERQNEAGLMTAEARRRANETSSAAKAMIAQLKNIEDAATIQRLEKENAALREEDVVIRTALFDLIRERKALYQNFDLLAARWGQGSPPSKADIEADVKEELNAPIGPGARMAGDIRVNVLIDETKKKLAR